MRIVTAILMVSGVVLPTASYSGYSPWRIEFWIAAFACAAIGALMGLGARSRILAALACGGFVALLADMHYTASIAAYGWFAIGGVGAIALLFAVCGYFWSAETMLVAAIVATTQILSGIALRAPAEWLYEAGNVKPSERPAVIHILLDEHGALDAVPDEAWDRSTRNAVAQGWNSAGFKLFRRAYTADDSTIVTLARIFNRPTETPRDLVEGRSGPEAYVITSAPLFAALGEKRALDVDAMAYVTFRQVAMAAGRVARFRQIDYPRILSGIDAANLPIQDRLKIATARMFDWTVKAAASRIMTWLGNKTGVYHRKGGIFYIWRSAYGFAAKESLDRLGERLANSGQRGTYYYAHYLLPHWPYLYSADCTPLRASDWRYNEVHEVDAADTLASRALRYRMYAQQVVCTQAAISAFVKKVRRNPALADATILVHGDHGSRLGLKNRVGVSPVEYDADAFARDQRATHFAIQGPAFDRSNETRPVRLDHLLKALWDSDFSDYSAALSRDTRDAPSWPEK